MFIATTITHMITPLVVPTPPPTTTTQASPHNAHNDLLVPDFGASSRQSTIAVAVINLMATIVGGGVLSLPWAFSRLGIGTATVLMLLAGYATAESLHLLCLSARFTGASSYGEVGRLAFGPAMETLVALLLGVFLLFVLVAYQVLLRDIWTPLVVFVLGYTNQDGINGNVVLAVLLILLGPFVVQYNLHALRYNCFVGFVSVSILCVALCHHAFWGTFPTHYDNDNHVDGTTPLYFTDQLADWLVAFPIIALSFLSHFNILPLQAALIQPSRQRTRQMIDVAVLGCGLLMYLFGLGGYVYAGADTKGNILLNLTAEASRNDPLFMLGRMGVGITIMVATPVMALPCRENLLEVVEILLGQEDQLETTLIGEQTALLRTEPIQKDPLQLDPLWHYGSTLIIMLITYAAAAAVPGVAVVWSLCGSSMAFLIAFILPAAYFLQISRREHVVESHHRGRIVFCWVLLVVSVVGAVACTLQTVLQMFH